MRNRQRDTYCAYTFLVAYLISEVHNLKSVQLSAHFLTCELSYEPWSDGTYFLWQFCSCLTKAVLTFHLVSSSSACPSGWGLVVALSHQHKPSMAGLLRWLFLHTANLSLTVLIGKQHVTKAGGDDPMFDFIALSNVPLFHSMHPRLCLWLGGDHQWKPLPNETLPYSSTKWYAFFMF